MSELELDPPYTGNNRVTVDPENRTPKLEEIDPQAEISRLRELVLTLQESQREISAILFNSTYRWGSLCDGMFQYIRQLEKKINKSEIEDSLIREMWHGKRVEEYQIGR